MELNDIITSGTDLYALFLTHKYIAASIVLVALLGRVFKGDLNVPLLAPYLAKIPSNWKVWIILVFGLGTSVLQKIGDGVTWQKAVFGGVIAAAVAVFGHQAIVESLRGGREFGVKKGSPNAPSTPPGPPNDVIPKAPKVPTSITTVMLVLAIACAGIVGCSWLDKNASTIPSTACSIIDTAQKACAIIRFQAANGQIVEERVSNAELAEFGQALSAKRRTEDRSSVAPVPALSSSAPAVPR